MYLAIGGLGMWANLRLAFVKYTEKPSRRTSDSTIKAPVTYKNTFNILQGDYSTRRNRKPLMFSSSSYFELLNRESLGSSKLNLGTRGSSRNLSSPGLYLRDESNFNFEHRVIAGFQRYAPPPFSSCFVG